MLFDDNSSEELSSSDDELDLLLVDSLFPPKSALHIRGPRLYIEDVSEEQCKMLFRYEYCMIHLSITVEDLSTA